MMNGLLLICRIKSFLAFGFLPHGKAVTVTLLLLAAGAASATKVIANWDVVPFQCISQPFKAGVVAFHETGVDVDFQINGEAAGRIADPTWNDQTGVFEYWIEINPTRYAAGPLTLSATAYPDGEGHESRTLTNLTLYANTGNSLTSKLVKWVDATNGSDTNGNGSEAAPYQTIKKAVLSVGDGGTVYLKAGTNYILNSIGGSNFTYWTTVTCAPGLTADDVHVGTYLKDNPASTGRYGKSGIRWGKISFYCDRATGWGSIFYLETGYRTWFDGSVFYDKNGRWADSVTFNNGGWGTYCTDCYARDLMNVNNTGILQRNMRYERIGSDVFRGSSNLTAINIYIRDINRGETSAHPDFFQFYSPVNPMENIIIYNCQAYDMGAQGIFGSEGIAKDVAFVNLLLEKDPAGSPLRSQASGPMDHVLLWNSTFVDQTFSFRDNTSGILNWDVRNCVFNIFSASNRTSISTCTIGYNHITALTWQQKDPLGTGTTVGDPCFMDYDNDDYRLRPSSPAYQTGTLLPGVPADVNGYLYNPVNPSRGAFSETNPGAVSPGTNSVKLTGVTVDYTTAPAYPVVRAYFTGNAREKYSAEASSNLQDWIPQAPRFACSQGNFDMAEIADSLVQQRFYRFTFP
jgi:hypothetical protein